MDVVDVIIKNLVLPLLIFSLAGLGVAAMVMVVRWLLNLTQKNNDGV